jgi:hypothetical protein
MHVQFAKVNRELFPVCQRQKRESALPNNRGSTAMFNLDTPDKARPQQRLWTPYNRPESGLDGLSNACA